MNMSFDLPEVLDAPAVAAEPPAFTIEAVPDLKALVVKEPTDIQPLIELCDRRAVAIAKPFDDLSLLEYACTIESMKVLERHALKRREAIEETNQALLDGIETWRKIAKACNEKAKKMGSTMNQYIYERDRAALKEQQRLNALAEQERLRLQKLEDDASKAARDKAQAGDVIGAAKSEAKAQQLAVKAEMTTADVVPMQAKTLDLGGGVTLSGKAPDKEWKLPGWDKSKPLRLNSPLLESLIGDMQALPEGVRFLLAHADLNPVYLNATYKGGFIRFPKPFDEGLKFGSSTLRGGK